MDLNSENVAKLFSSCLFDDEYTGENQPSKEYWAEGGGVVRQFVFDIRKIKNHKEDIKSLLDQLPNSFKDNMIGDSFIMMPFTKNGYQWGEQRNAEQLMTLGVASGYLQVSPRKVWMCTHGVPYIRYYDEGTDKKEMSIYQFVDGLLLKEIAK